MIILDGAHVLTNHPGRSEYAAGHIVTDGTRIVHVGDGPAPEGADEIGSLEVGKLADMAVWRLDTLASKTLLARAGA